MLRRLRSGDRGAAAAEFALVLPLLLLIVFGIIDFGRMLNLQLTLTEGAREGSRLSVVAPTSSVSAVDTRVERVTGSGTTVTRNISCLNATAGAEVVVTASKRFEFVTPVGALAEIFGNGAWATDFTMTAQGVGTCRS